MKTRLRNLELSCKQAVVSVPLSQFNYFHGEMGAGKSTIARLIDYCLGGGIEMTPALQSEFVAAALDLEMQDVPLRLERAAGSDQILARWGIGEGAQQLVLPAREADGVVLAGTQVEVLSDLLFYLAGVTAPKVRRSRVKEDSGLERLSFRDLFWYCYLDQESIDSSFFHLDPDADVYKRLKSRKVLGFLLGFNQQRVAELEAELDTTRSDRVTAAEAADTLQKSLEDAGVESELGIAQRLQQLGSEKQKVELKIETTREQLKQKRTHVADQLSNRARQLVSELSAVRTAIEEVQAAIGRNRRHYNELLALTTKFQRVTGARAVLNGVEFERCPRCTQSLPTRGRGTCSLCGQADAGDIEQGVSVTDKDMSSRRAELEEIIHEQDEQLRALHAREAILVQEKSRVDEQLTAEMEHYDSAYLSELLEFERKAAAVSEEVRFLERLRVLPARVESLKTEADVLRIKEVELRRLLKEAREAAERDQSNLKLLCDLFLDCLVRAKIPGFTSNDTVTMNSPGFLPEVTGVTTGEMAITSFGTLGSGGKKTLFKCCFAVAIHRLAQKIGSVLPTLLIIDSPMKNISERENRTQFEGFHRMLYELADTELQGTQLILIDKELCPPTADHEFEIVTRHLTVDQESDPPLIPYYRERIGRQEPDAETQDNSGSADAS